MADIDQRLITQLHSSHNEHHRTMILLVSPEPHSIIVELYYMLTKHIPTPTILNMSKSKPTFNSHQTHKKIKKSLSSLEDATNIYEMFSECANITNCCYKECDNILGNSFSMLVLNDFECITPNILCKTVETVSGGGLILMICSQVSTIKELYDVQMKAHDNYKTYQFSKVCHNYNKRLVLSLRKLHNFIAIDDKYNLLPISYEYVDTLDLVELKATQEAKKLKVAKQADAKANQLAEICKTQSQMDAFIDIAHHVCNRKQGTIVITAARGRGKSALLGITIAYALSMGYSYINVVSPSPTNVITVFQFVIKGISLLGYQDKQNCQIVNDDGIVTKIIITTSTHKQYVEYSLPTKTNIGSRMDLLVIDEAASIPLNIVKELCSLDFVIMSSTVNGYEGTGRSLSLKLVEELKTKAKKTNKDLLEIKLSGSIRYSDDDPIENWLNGLLCLNPAEEMYDCNSAPSTQSCKLYSINKKVLFSGHKSSEKWLRRIISLFATSHYKNSPNDIQLLADAPAHEIMLLLNQNFTDSHGYPIILCALQLCYEGGIPKDEAIKNVMNATKQNGDLITWTVIEQYQAYEFGSLHGVRIVRIACFPEFQGKGYGSYSLSELKKIYSQKQRPVPANATESELQLPTNEALLTESIRPEHIKEPLMVPLNYHNHAIDFIGTSFGINPQLYRFWKRNDYKLVYIRQTPNITTAEYSCLMITEISPRTSTGSMCAKYVMRLISLLGYELRKFICTMAENILDGESMPSVDMVTITKDDVSRLQSYITSLTDYRLIIDIIPSIARMYYTSKLSKMSITSEQRSLLVGIGLQYKSIDEVSKELGLTHGDAIKMLNRVIMGAIPLLKLIAK